MTLMNQRRQLLDGYDDAFFKNNDLLMIFNKEGSGSVRYDVTDVAIESGHCNVTVQTVEPDGSCDIAFWLIFVSIPKDVSSSITKYDYTILPYVWVTQGG